MSKRLIILISIVIVIVISVFVLYQKNTPCKKIINERTSPPDPNVAVCLAMPELWKNPATGECMYRGCGYSPYGSPGSGWIQIQ